MESDLVLTKKTTDVIVVGHAYPSDARGMTQLGAIGSHWQPRVGFAGTYDDKSLFEDDELELV